MKRQSTTPPARHRASTRSKGKRRPGRPRTVHAVASRDTIVAAARQLLDEVPPHQATISSIARKAGVDPALVRYYFRGREQLLLAVIEDILASWAASHPATGTTPAQRLAGHVGDMLDFARRVRSMQRLMIDECAGSRSAAVRRKVREINAGAVDRHALLLRMEKKRTRNSTDPLFLFVAVVGMCEFFAAAQPMILPLAPDGISPEDLAGRYRKFIARLVLDGMRAHVEPVAP